MKTQSFRSRHSIGWFFAFWLLRATFVQAQPADTNSTPAPTNSVASPSADTQTNDPIARIREEGLNHSQVMKTLSYLTDVIGQRLTGSPNLRRANEWTREKLSGWGLTNSHLEAWGPFGVGWSLKRFSIQVIEPQTIPLIGFPKAWSPGFDDPVMADVAYFDVKEESDFERYKGKLNGAIVLMSPPREVKARFEPLATRMADTNLLKLANAGPPRTFSPRIDSTNAPAGEGRGAPRALGRRRRSDSTNSTDNAASVARPRSVGGPSGRAALAARSLAFLAKQGVTALITPSSQGDGGTYFVSQATVPGANPGAPGGATNSIRVWATNAPSIPPQITLATEDYNRLVRMIQQGEKLKIALDLRVQFHRDDLMAFNTLAEIAGGDLSNETVMLGAHLDSWHAGTGATDNGAGVAVTMEAMRILKTLNLEPRRTIRIGLWTGEEQGLLGSKAYVTQHFGYYTNLTNSLGEQMDSSPGTNSNSRVTRKLMRQQEYENLCAYFNLDNGTGKIRGVYMQDNEAVRSLFRQWLQPFSDLGAQTLSLSNTGGTDHQSFDGIGLPGFQFIQDEIEYASRTHHSNADVFDRIQEDDLKQAAVIMAAFVYNAAMADQKLPRKSIE